eukprot:6771931-Alexandrium_andersonii.AAC.1
MTVHPNMDYIYKVFGWHRVFTWMGAFGAPTRKATVLWSSEPWIQKMARKIDTKEGHWNSDDVVFKLRPKDGNHNRICGGKGLKQTQEYP